MRFSIGKNMQVVGQVVCPVSINMVDYLSALGTSYFSMFPFASASIAAVPQSQSAVLRCRRTIRLGCRRLRCNRHQAISGRRDHPVSAPSVLPWGKSLNLLGVGIQRVAVFAGHEVVTVAKVFGEHWSVAKGAGSANHFAAPSIVRRPVPLHSLVVHEAKVAGSVLPPASLYRAFSVFARCRHRQSFPFPKTLYSYKALGNSMAVNCMKWIGERIAMVEAALPISEETTDA